MPDIPGLKNVPQTEYDRVIATFPGTTMAEKAAAHRAWLIEQYRFKVNRSEQEEAAAQVVLDNATLLDTAT